MTDHTPDTISITEYLAVRLRQLGVDHLFGVPGDFNLVLLDALEEADGPQWIGTANELGAGYAADGYARRRGFGAVLTTYGVGELSAINAIAGAYSERVPVLQITGSPSTEAARDGLPLHHTLLDGDYGHFARAYAEVTVAQATLSRDGDAHGLDAGAQIDAVLEAMLDEHLPGYLSIPEDLVLAPVAAAPLHHPLTARSSDPRAVAALRRRVAAELSGERVALLVGAGAQRAGAADAVVALAETAALPIATLHDALGLIDARHPLHRGIYTGALGDEDAREVVEGADRVIAVGALLSDTLSGGFTATLDDDALIEVGLTSTRIGTTTYAVRLRDALTVLREAFGGLNGHQPLDPPNAPRAGAAGEAVAGDEGGDGPLTQDQLWPRFAAGLPSGHTLVADAGTSYFGIIGTSLPPDTVLHGQPLWSSIGYALPAGLGTALAEPHRRTVVLIGDGAAQMTVQELGTMLRQGVHPIVLLVDNDGYTIERVIRGPEAAYNDIARWDWSLIVRGLDGDAGRVALLEAATADELDAALDAAHAMPDRLVFLRVRAGRHDVPPALAALAERVARRAVPS